MGKENRIGLWRVVCGSNILMLLSELCTACIHIYKCKLDLALPGNKADVRHHIPDRQDTLGSMDVWASVSENSYCMSCKSHQSCRCLCLSLIPNLLRKERIWLVFCINMWCDSEMIFNLWLWICAHEELTREKPKIRRIWHWRMCVIFRSCNSTFVSFI